METKDIAIEQVDINTLNPAPYNPRVFGDKEYKHLKESITKFGLVDPLIVNSVNNTIIGGHFRLKVAKDLGYTHVPCVFVNITDVEREKELNIRLNKNLGDWDFGMLADFDMDMLKDIGFNNKEIHRIFDPDLAEDNFDAQKAYEAITEPRAKIGDIYSLGDHRLMCGDSSKEEDVGRLMGGGRGQTHIY